MTYNVFGGTLNLTQSIIREKLYDGVGSNLAAKRRFLAVKQNQNRCRQKRFLC